MKKWILMGFLFLCTFSALSATWIEFDKLLPSDGAAGDYFGPSISLSGNLALVGAHLDDDKGSDSGSAYLFDVTTGEKLHKFLKQIPGTVYDEFGSSVALCGNVALVGVRNGNWNHSGSAYLFDAVTGEQLYRLVPDDGAEDDYFGESVALDGEVVLVGAYKNDDNGSSSGSAYVFDATTGEQLRKLLPSDGTNDSYFGFSVALDGNLALIGAYGDDDNGANSGSAYLFDLTTGEQLHKLLPPDGALHDYFGWSVALEGNVALIGVLLDDDNGYDSGSAYLFDVTTGEQLRKLLPSDGSSGYFGCSVALNGNLALVGAYRYGSAYLFDVTTGEQLQKLVPADSASLDYFGRSVALNDKIALVGAPYGGYRSGSIYWFTDQVRLSVRSDHGEAVPNSGTTWYERGCVVTCSVDMIVADSFTNWICSGWLGSGSISSSGEDNSTGPIILTNLESSITWLWPTYTVNDLWAENVSAAQRAGTKLVDVSYDMHSTEANWVAVSLSVDAGAVGSGSVSGDVGADVSTGAGKSLIWDAGADWDGNVDNLTFQILSEDAQGASVETPSERVRIPAGRNTGTDPDNGAYSLTVSNSLFVDASEITKAQWDGVHDWAVTNGYSFANAGSGSASNHPVHTVSWHDVLKWCNARSAMEGFTSCYDTNDWSCDFNANGYRLPTSEEWKYAARGGLSGKRFPCGDTIAHSNANYYSSAAYAYDVSATRGFHPVYGAGTAPESSGASNGYGLYAMAANVMEWCQDESGANRVLAGGSWDQFAAEARCAYQSWSAPSAAAVNIGFRTVQRSSSSASSTEPSVSVDTRDYLLSISSNHGTPIPNIGTNTYAWYATVTCSVDSAVTSGLTNWTSSGWSGSGSVPSEGATPNTGGVILTGMTSSIAWAWNTNYWMDVSTLGSGSVDPGDGWQPAGSNVTVDAAASSGWLFMGWSGDASGDYTQERVIVPMVCSVSVTATFSDDADDDGLFNTNETALGTDPRKKDSDGDGSDDPDELIAGTSPTNSTSVLDVQLSTGESANELSWYGVSERYYQLEYTDDLGGVWTPKGTVISGADAVILRIDVGGDSTRFYRVRVSDNPDNFN